MAQFVPGINQVQSKRFIEIGVVIIGFIDAIAGQRRATNARVHVHAKNNIVIVIRCAFIADVIMPENHITGLRIGPLEAAHLNAQSHATTGLVTAIGIVVPGVIEIIIHHGKAFLIGIGALAEIAVPAPAPAGIIDIIDFIRPGIGPGTRIIADSGRTALVDAGIGLKITGPWLVAHDAIADGTGALALAIAGFHDMKIGAFAIQ